MYRSVQDRLVCGVDLVSGARVGAGWHLGSSQESQCFRQLVNVSWNTITGLLLESLVIYFSFYHPLVILGSCYLLVIFLASCLPLPGLTGQPVMALRYWGSRLSVLCQFSSLDFFSPLYIVNKNSRVADCNVLEQHLEFFLTF